MTQIIRGKLWLGDRVDARKMGKDMTLVVNCTEHLPVSKCLKNIRIPIGDPGEGCKNSEYIQKKYAKYAVPVVKEIKKEIDAGGKVLVHCHVGAQRSAALVLLYLVLYGKWASLQSRKLPDSVVNKEKFKKARNFLIKKRPVAFFGGDYMSFECAIKTILGI